MKRRVDTFWHAGAARLVVGCLVAMVLWPSSSWASTARCLDWSTSTVASGGVTQFVSPTPTLTRPNGGMTFDEHLFGPSQSPGNGVLCADGEVGSTQSTCPDVPSVAHSLVGVAVDWWSGDQSANTVIGAVMDAINRPEVRTDSMVVAASFEVEPLPDDSGQACYGNPNECRSLPPLPASLVVDASAPAAGSTNDRFVFPALPSSDGGPPWAPPRVGPQSGHRPPPYQPPRVS